MTTIVATLPKVDLHCELLGAVTPELLAEWLAEAGDGRAPAALVGRGGAAAWDATLDGVAALVRKPRQIEALAYGLGQRAILDAVVHVELVVEPLRLALPAAAAFEALERGLDRAVEASDDALLSWSLIVAARRGDDAAAWTEALAAWRAAAGDRLRAVALLGDEARDAAGLVPALQRARADGLPVVVTAGYGGRWRDVDAALALEPVRVVHGVHLLRHEDALTALRARRVAVICLPTLEARCELVREGTPPSVGRLGEAGLFATVATGAPGLLQTNLSAEFDRTSHGLGWRLEQMRTATARAVEAAFIDPKLRFVVARAVENWRHRPRLSAGSTDDGFGM
jgi:adenosine deaminase